MTNREYYAEWIKSAVDGMPVDEFCRFVLAFQEGYDDGVHRLECTDVCGHSPDENCRDCVDRTVAFMLSER